VRLFGNSSWLMCTPYSINSSKSIHGKLLWSQNTYTLERSCSRHVCVPSINNFGLECLVSCKACSSQIPLNVSPNRHRDDCLRDCSCSWTLFKEDFVMLISTLMTWKLLVWLAYWPLTYFFQYYIVNSVMSRSYCVCNAIRPSTLKIRNLKPKLYWSLT